MTAIRRPSGKSAKWRTIQAEAPTDGPSDIMASLVRLDMMAFGSMALAFGMFLGSRSAVEGSVGGGIVRAHSGQ